MLSVEKLNECGMILIPLGEVRSFAGWLYMIFVQILLFSDIVSYDTDISHQPKCLRRVASWGFSACSNFPFRDIGRNTGNPHHPSRCSGGVCEQCEQCGIFAKREGEGLTE